MKNLTNYRDSTVPTNLFGTWMYFKDVNDVLSRVLHICGTNYLDSTVSTNLIMSVQGNFFWHLNVLSLLTKT